MPVRATGGGRGHGQLRRGHSQCGAAGPEVIFIGEIRDRDTVQTAMLAAETGHLVLATLHADSVPQTLDRIRELHPASEQANASTLLAGA